MRAHPPPGVKNIIVQKSTDGVIWLGTGGLLLSPVTNQLVAAFSLHYFPQQSPLPWAAPSACMGVCRGRYVTTDRPALTMVGSLLHRPEEDCFRRALEAGQTPPPRGSGPNAKKYAIATVSAYRVSMPPIRSIPGESISLPAFRAVGRSHPRSVLRGIFTKMGGDGLRCTRDDTSGFFDCRGGTTTVGFLLLSLRPICKYRPSLRSSSKSR
jgi:hypothetical protein